jgi:hypothetical protein
MKDTDGTPIAIARAPLTNGVRDVPRPPPANMQHFANDYLRGRRYPAPFFARLWYSLRAAYDSFRLEWELWS